MVPLSTPTLAAPIVQTPQELHVLVFRVQGEECAVELTATREIIPAGILTPVPSAPPSVRGMVNLRGRIVTVLDSGLLLGLLQNTESRGKHVIVAERGNDVFGILVDDVTGVLRAPADTLQTTPELVQSRPGARYVRGVIILQDAPMKKTQEAQNEEKNTALPAARLLVLLDLPAMLAGASGVQIPPSSSPSAV